MDAQSSGDLVEDVGFGIQGLLERGPHYIRFAADRIPGGVAKRCSGLSWFHETR
jgi:hypothetical protein